MTKRTPEEKALHDSWQTPDWVLNYAEALLGRPFSLDLAAAPGNAVAPRYFTADDPAQERLRAATLGAAWLNPPFSDIHSHVRAALRGYREGRFPALGLLTLGDISTQYWAELQDHNATQVPIIGRWSCVPPPGLSVSQSKVAFALWLLSDKPIPRTLAVHYKLIGEVFGTPRRRY
jgi:phage N-6-adenine-methyltransferase